MNHHEPFTREDQNEDLFALGLVIEYPTTMVISSSSKPDVLVGARGRLGGGWLFDLSRHRMAREELFAVVKSLPAYRRENTADDFLRKGRAVLTVRAEDEQDAKGQLNHFLIHCAALSQWGCGPLDGFRWPTHVSRSPMIQQQANMEAQITSLIQRRRLDDACEDAQASAAPKSPRL
jgi:hypothetical protein